MSGLIHFVSGKSLEITEQEFRNIGPKLNAKGIKTQPTKSGHLIPLNSTTMEFIEHVKEQEERIVVKKTTTPEPMELPVEQPKEMKEQEAPKKKTQAELLEDITAKSNCKHEPEKLELYKQHTAKGVRYFPLCSFCGKRERYVSEKKILDGAYVGTVNEKWTEEDILNAKDYVEV